MGRCSYIWKERIEYTDKLIEVQCSQEIWEGSKKYCIFHDPSQNKDIELFRNKMREKLERKDYKFTGYYFLEDLDLSNFKFEEDVNFRKCVFYGNAFFNNAIFHEMVDFFKTQFLGEAAFHKTRFIGKANFSYSIFSKGAHFISAEFSQESNFSNSHFKGRANFYWTKFFCAVEFSGGEFYQDVEFIKTRFEGYINFNSARFHGKLLMTPAHTEALNFSSALFSSKSKIEADMSKAKFCNSTIQVVDLTGCQWPDKEIIYEEQLFKSKEAPEYEKCSPDKLEIIYRNLRESYLRSGDSGQAGKFYFREKEMERKTKRKGRKRIRSLWLTLIYALCGYGEHLWKVVVWAITANIFFILSYVITDGISFTGSCLSQKLWQSSYFSIITFMTFGYGDFHPVNVAGQVLTLAEALTGAFFFALFVVIFARKITR